MASSLPAAVPVVTKASSSSQRHSGHNCKLFFHLSSKPKLLFSAKGSRTNWTRSVITKVQLSKAPVDGSSNAAPTPDSKSEVPSLEGKGSVPESEASPVVSASEASISEFMAQVSSLIKLVDSRDIVELQLKQFDCELIIRKKEALPQQVQAPVVMMQPPSPQAAIPHAQPTASTPAGPAPSSTPSPTPPSAAKPAKSSLPPLKCPMAGTFYRSPGPGEPPFVKIGDKVKKGQVLCIIEAMKLMNEIEADQSGTLVEIVAEDGKTVSVDTPLFVIEP